MELWSHFKKVSVFKLTLYHNSRWKQNVYLENKDVKLRGQLIQTTGVYKLEFRKKEIIVYFQFVVIPEKLVIIEKRTYKNLSSKHSCAAKQNSSML